MDYGYGDFLHSFLVAAERSTPSEVDSSVFRQVQSPGSIVHNLPTNSPTLRTPTLASGTLPGPSSGNHQSPLFPLPSSVGRAADEFRLQSLPIENIARRITRRQTPPVSRTASDESSVSAKDVLSRTMSRVWFERNADKAHSLLKKEQSAARNKELRKHLEYIEDTEWFYQPIDKLIGQY